MTNPNKSHKAWNKGQDCRIDLICPECGSGFKRYPSQIRGVNFCTIQCKSASTIGVERPGLGEKIARKLKGVKWSDERKRNIIGRKPSYGNTGKKHSKETKQKISLANRRCEVEEFNGYTSSKNKLERLRFQREVQPTVFERDNYCCQECDQRGGRLQAAHILSWAEYPELRFNLDNCRTLCMACHYFETFGRELPEDVTTWGHNLSQIGG